ncbi:hypothetical protein [Thalassotalea litorea]|nr:hypothetical protein [Thalassotalea litorea]
MARKRAFFEFMLGKSVGGKTPFPILAMALIYKAGITRYNRAQE